MKRYLSGLIFLVGLICGGANMAFGQHTITVTTVNGTPVCAGSMVAVVYTVNTTFTAGNTFTAQLSDNTGSFSSPVNIGTLSSTGSSTITATIPALTTTSGNYFIQIVSTNPAHTSLNAIGPFTVYASAPSALTAAASPGALCSGSNLTLTGSATDATSYSWTGPGYAGSTSLNPPAFAANPSSGGVYTLTATNACGSTSAATTVVTVNPLPTSVTATASPNPVCNGANLTLTGTATGATSYSWAGPGGYSAATLNPTPAAASSPSSAGIYTLTATNSCGSVTAATLSVTVNTVPVGVTAIASPNPVCSGANLTLTGTGPNGTSFLWAGPGGYNSTSLNPTPAAASPSSAGIYTLTVSNSCGSSLPMTTAAVTVNATPTLVTATATPSPVCAGANLTLGGSATGATSYSWTGPGYSNSGLLSPAAVLTASASSAGVYTLTATNSCGSTPASTSAVAVNTAPTSVTANATPNPVCVAASLSLSGAAAGASSYSWAGPNGFSSGTLSSSLTASALSAGVYTLTATNSCGPTRAVTLTVTVNGVPASVTATALPNPLCNGANLSLTGSATSAVSYSWAGPGGFSSAPSGSSSSSLTATALSTGVYTLTATNTCGSAKANTSFVTVNPLPAAITGSSAVCVNSTITLVDAGGTWSIGSGTAASVSGLGVVSGLTAGTASVVYTLPTTCKASKTVTVNGLPAITASASPNPICVGGNLGLTSSPSGGSSSYSSFSWTGPSGFSAAAQTASRNPIATSGAGVYSVTVTDSHGCTSAAGTTITVTVNLLPTITAVAAPASICAGQTLNLTSTPTGGSGTYPTFTWSGPLGFSSAGQNITRTNITSGGAGIYTVTVTDNNGCSAATPATTAAVTVNPLPAIAANATPNPICAGSTLTLNATPSGGSTVYSGFSWQGPLSFTAATQNTTRANLLAGEAGIYSVTVTDNKGCVSPAGFTLAVVVNPLPVITATATPTSICATATLSLNATPSGGSGTFSTYSWRGPGSFTASTRNTTVTNISAAGAGVYSVSVTDSHGCISAVPGTTASVVVNPLPSAIGGIADVCAGLTTTLTATPASGTWSSSGADATVVAGSGIVTGVSAGDVVITYTLASNCFSTTPFTVNPLPAAITGNAAVCQGASVTLSDPTSSGTWSSGSASVVSIVPGTGVATGVSAGSGLVTYTLATGCIASSVVTVNTLPAAPAITLAPSGTVCVGTMYENFSASSSTAGVSYRWSAPGDSVWSGRNTQNCLVNFLTVGSDVVTVTAKINSTGCSSHTDVTITVNATQAPQEDTILYFESSLVCLQRDMLYLWGYDDSATLVSTVLAGDDTNQNYYFAPSPGPDFVNNFYWVKTTDPSTGCTQKSYYHLPPGGRGVVNNNSSNELGAMKVYPNPAGSYLEVQFDNLESNIELKITDVMGREVMTLPVQNIQTRIDLSGLQPSMYFLDCYHNGVKVADSRFVKN